MREYNRQRRKLPEVKERERQYQRTDRVKELRRKYYSSPECKELRRQYRKSLKGAESKRREALKYNYGIGLEEYDRLFDKQRGRCAICFETCPGKKRLSVDHNHTTGAIRGLLCARCNFMLGYSGDSILVLHEAVRYLEASNEKE